MTDEDVLGLLIYANELDARHAPNEAKVYAWNEVFTDAAPNMPIAFAKEVIRAHYGKHEHMISPAIIVKAWKDNRRMKANAALALDADNVDAHCGMKDCHCTHTKPCFKGWIDGGEPHTTPCPVCRRSLSEVLSRVSVLGARTDYEQSMIRQRFYEGAHHD